MNTTPILTTAFLLAASVPAFCQDDPFAAPRERGRSAPQPAEAADADPFAGSGHQPRRARPSGPAPADPFGGTPANEPLRQRIEVDFVDVPLPEVIDYLRSKSEKPLNFVVRPPADEVIVPTMRIRDVSIETVLEVIEGLTPIHISTIRGDDHGAPVIVIQARETPRSIFRSTGTTAHLLPPGTPPAGARQTEPPRPGQIRLVAPVIDPNDQPPPFTRAYPVKPILETVELESLVSLIQEFWSRSEPDWAQQSGEKAISLHEATGMLIVKAPEPRQEEIRSLLDGLESTIKATEPDPEVLKLQGRLVELEHRAELAMRTAEEQRAMSKDTEAMLREVIGQRDQEVIQLQREISELKDSLERAKTRK